MVRLLLKQNLKSLVKGMVLILSMLQVLVTRLVKGIEDKVDNNGTQETKEKSNIW